jgi:opacity protein-like surface antigen
MIQHRFGALNTGIYNFFGLDNANTRLGLDYGITDRLAAGAGRSSLAKTYDAYLKFKLFRQTDQSLRMPISVSILGTFSNFTDSVAQYNYPFESSTQVSFSTKDRTAYTAQLLIARKFSSNFSMQLTPTFIHYNTVPHSTDKNNMFALGAGARMKITKRMSINAEYNYLPSGQVVSYSTHDCFSLGWDIETGGHVFQLVFSNSQSMIESQYLAQTPGSWGNGDIYFGFNISRNFNLTKKAKARSVPKT